MRTVRKAAASDAEVAGEAKGFEEGAGQYAGTAKSFAGAEPGGGELRKGRMHLKHQRQQTATRGKAGKYVADLV